MDSEVPEMPEPSLRRSSRHRDLSTLLPILLGFTGNAITINSTQNQDDSTTTDSDQVTNPSDSLDRIVLVNPFTQGMAVIEGSSSSFDSLLRDLLSKDGQPPASKASIEAMRDVEIGECEGEDGECVICLEEWKVGVVAKEMPCKHKFHGDCIKKWLEIHGSCPVCRYNMPVDDDHDFGKKISASGSEGRGRRGRREIWVNFSINSDIRRSGDTNHAD